MTFRHFFVDEAGDLTFFDKKGRIIVGHEGVSTAFMVGVAELPDPEHAHQQLEMLRHELLKDSYFRGVPSMQPQARKTAICFHAKNDLPEVRREVFKLLPSLGVKVQVVFRRKHEIAVDARQMFRKHGSALQTNAIYDDLIKRLFRNLLHKADNQITFARRGKSDRQEALDRALNHAKRNFEAKYSIPSDKETKAIPAYPSEAAGLQVVDYFLWALQRMIERQEDRFFSILEGQYRLIVDLDDKRHKPYGEYYSDSNPLTLEKMKPVMG